MGEPVKVNKLVQQIRQEAAEMLREDPCSDWANGFIIQQLAEEIIQEEPADSPFRHLFVEDPAPTEQGHACADIQNSDDVAPNTVECSGWTCIGWRRRGKTADPRCKYCGGTGKV